MDHFIWTPGNGVNTAALHRIRTHFKRPIEPMGEAWFMAEERRYFNELMGNIDSLSPYELQEPLEEIASGTSSFGPHDEWRAWYHFLLGETLPRSHEAFVNPLLELLITGFMALYPKCEHSPPYDGFRDDVLLSLGCCMMDSNCWNGTEIALGKILHRSNNNPNRVWCWWNASGDFSASMFFCLKYLPPSLVRDWLQSVLDIPSAHWRAQIIVWMVGAHDILQGQVQWPSEFPVDARPTIYWEWSHCLGPELAIEITDPCTISFLPNESRYQALQLLHSYFQAHVYQGWLSSISRVPYIVEELAEIPATFKQLYVHG